MTTYVGDLARPTLTVSPADGTTAATLLIIDPDGVETAGSVSGSAGAWTATSYALTKAGEWYELWTVTGTGAGARTYTRTVEPQPEPSAPLPGSYANTQDFYDWTGDAGPRPTGLVQLLRRCSQDVDRVLLSSVYDATDADVITALMQATCEQAVWRCENGQESGVPVGFHSVQIGSVNLTRGYSGAGSGANDDHFSPQAFVILQTAGLTGGAPYVSA